MGGIQLEGIQLLQYPFWLPPLPHLTAEKSQAGLVPFTHEVGSRVQLSKAAKLRSQLCCPVTKLC